MRNLFHIVKYTVIDIVHQKSFFVLLGVSIAFVLLLRGCYSANWVVNNKPLDNNTLAFDASIIAFHIVAIGVLLIAAILSMNLFRRDREDGTVQYMLSKPVSRISYVLGRALGVWLVAFAFMFVLHFTIFVISWISTKGYIPGYLFASCLCSINVLFMILLVCLFSLFMPDFAAAFSGLGVAAISYVSDGIFHLIQSTFVQTATNGAPPAVSVWRMVWPKVMSAQHFAVSLIDKRAQFHSIGPVHPLIVMTIYLFLVAAALAFAFQRKEI
jgi:ABC-type transport system involved in multi-copper enzyme maturation permease subunit